jgi:hypothetical protein
MKTTAAIYLCRCGYNCVTEDAEIGFPAPGDTGRHGAPRSRMLQAAWQEESQTKGNGANRTGSHQMSVAQYIAQLNFVSIGKLLRDLVRRSPCTL